MKRSKNLQERENPTKKEKYIVRTEEHLNKPVHRLKDKKIIKTIITTMNC